MPSSCLALGSAPASTSAFTTAGSVLNAAAWCRGVTPFSSLASRFAPAASSTFTTSGFSFSTAAWCRGGHAILSPCIGVCTGIHQRLHHGWILAECRRTVQGGHAILMPCVGVSTGSQQRLHHCWFRAEHRRLVQGGLAIFIPCLGVCPLGDATANIRRRCLLEELPGIPVRTIRAGNSGACCQQQGTGSQQCQDAACLVAVVGHGLLTRVRHGQRVPRLTRLDLGGSGVPGVAGVHSGLSACPGHHPAPSPPLERGSGKRPQHPPGRYG